MFRFNIRGFLMMLPAVASGYLVAWLMGELSNNYFVAMIAGIVMIPIDLYHRYQNNDEKLTSFRRWFAIDSGGWVAFPIWCLGLGFILLYVIPEGYIESL